MSGIRNGHFNVIHGYFWCALNGNRMAVHLKHLFYQSETFLDLSYFDRIALLIQISPKAVGHGTATTMLVFSSLLFCACAMCNLSMWQCQ